jgi:hypothetical protein
MSLLNNILKVSEQANYIHFRGSFTNGIGLSKRQEHKWNREKCLQVFEENYGYNPLLLNEYRIDSSHYGHDEQFQCFEDT